MRQSRYSSLATLLLLTGCIGTAPGNGDPNGDSAVGGDIDSSGDVGANGDAGPNGDTAPGADADFGDAGEPNVRIVAVEASSHDGNGPEKTLDRDFSPESRWSAQGDGEWIAFTLSEAAPVDFVQLAAYAETAKYFDLQYSLDGTSWIDLATELETLPDMPGIYQRFDLTPVTAVKIRYVGHGSSASLWNSLVEVDVSGYPVDLGGSPCTPHASFTCSGDHVFWFDSCDSREEEKEHCDATESCVIDTCILDDPGPITVEDIETILLVDYETSELGTYHWSEFQADYNNWEYAYSIHSGMPGGNGEYTVSIVEDGDLATNQCMRVYYPEGEWGLLGSADDDIGGGIQAWNYIEPTELRELYMSYNIRFRQWFNPVQGGKLPAFNSGNQNYEGTDTGFSGTLMFRNGSRLAFYIMYPGLGSSGHSESTLWPDPYTSDEYFRFDFSSHDWYNITIRYVLNTFTDGAPNSDGLIEGFVNGRLYAQKLDFVLVNDESLYFDIILMKSFFGGDNIDWAPTTTEHIDFDDVSLFWYKDTVNVPRGQEVSPAGRELVLPNWPKP